MQSKYWLPSLLVLALASVPALADEIVYFTNGTSMPVKSYLIEDGTIRLDLGDQAYVAFSVDQIDRIETTEGEVRNANSSPANRMVAGGSTGTVPSRHRRQAQGGSAANQHGRQEPGIETHNGIAIHRPYGNSPIPNRRNVATVVHEGSAAITSRATQNGVIGTSRVGSRFTIPTEQSEKNLKPRHVSLKSGTPSKSRKPDDEKK